MTKFPGGLELMLSLGFNLSIDRETEEEIISKGEIRDLIALIVLKMEEPSPEKDMSNWIAWFDRLSVYIQLFDI